MTQNLIQERLSLLSEDYQTFINGDFVSDVSVLFGEKHNFTDWQTIVLQNALLGYLLFFTNQEECAVFISRECELPLPDAEVLVSAIITLLPNQFASTHEYVYGVFSGQITPEANTTEHSGLRTMSDDMAVAQQPSTDVQSPTYTSTQAAILREGKPATTNRPGSNNTTWETT